MKISVVLLFAVLIAGCSGSTGEDSDTQPLNSPVVLSVRETFPNYATDEDPLPTILLATAEDLECCNYVIVSNLQPVGSTLGISISGVKLPGRICYTAFGPAQAEFVVPQMAKYRQIVLWYHGQTDLYDVAVDDSTFRISQRGEHFAELADTLVWRFPKRSFVYTCGTLTEDSCLCTQFRDSLMAHLSLAPISAPTEGYWPYTRRSQGHYYDMPAEVYRYSDESAFQTAGALLAAFKRTTLAGHSGVGIELRNWRNTSYASWMIPASSGPGEEVSRNVLSQSEFATR